MDFLLRPNISETVISINALYKHQSTFPYIPPFRGKNFQAKLMADDSTKAAFSSYAEIWRLRRLMMTAISKYLLGLL